MMGNAVFIVLFIMSCAYQVSIVSGENCTELTQLPYSHACMFECIENLYDEHFCKVCSYHNPIKYDESDLLATLLMYDFVRFNVTSETIYSMPHCSGCVKNESLEHVFVEYAVPHVLHEFLELTAKSHHTKVNHTVAETIHELYANITNQLDETKQWCVNALGIANEYNAFKRSIENTTDDSDTKSSVPSIDSTTAAPSTTTTNHADDELANQNSQSSTSTASSIQNVNESSSTTEMPNQTIAIASNVTSMLPTIGDQTPDASKNSTTKSKKPTKLHEHHYHYSMAIITIVSLILLTILIVSIILISLYVKRTKRMGAHLTSSSTYVFNHQN